MDKTRSPFSDAKKQDVEPSTTKTIFEEHDKEPPAKKPKLSDADEDDLWFDHDKKVEEHQASQDQDKSYTLKQLIETDLKKFLSRKAEPRNTNPIEFWFKNKDHYPFVYSVAAKYLACPGSSVASEETFSNVATFRRSGDFGGP